MWIWTWNVIQNKCLKLALEVADIEIIIRIQIIYPVKVARRNQGKEKRREKGWYLSTEFSPEEAVIVSAIFGFRWTQKGFREQIDWWEEDDPWNIKGNGTRRQPWNQSRANETDASLPSFSNNLSALLSFAYLVFYYSQIAKFYLVVFTILLNSPFLFLFYY